MDEESESRKPSVDPGVGIVLIYRYQGGSQVGLNEDWNNYKGPKLEIR